MRIDRYTQKMQEGLQAAQDLASQLNDSEITNEHFLSALLDQSDGMARPLLEKIGANVDQLQERLRADLERRPKIHGSAADLRISNELRTVLDNAEKEMSKLKDEFTSAEHYLLALAGANVPATKLLKDSGVTRDKLMQGLQQVRGSQRVTDQNPEGKFQALEKYGRDLTELARRGKIDPVIGQKIIRCSLAIRVSVKQRSRKAWPGASSVATFRIRSKISASLRWTSAQWSLAPSTVENSKIASRLS